MNRSISTCKWAYPDFCNSVIVMKEIDTPWRRFRYVRNLFQHSRICVIDSAAVQVEGSSVKVRNLRRSRLPAALIIALRTRLAFFGPHSSQAQHLHPNRVYRHAALSCAVISPRSAHRPQLLLLRLRPTTSSEEGM